MRFVEQLDCTFVFYVMRRDDRHEAIVHAFFEWIVFFEDLKPERFEPAKINDVGDVRCKINIVRANENIHIDCKHSFLLRR